MWQSKWWEVIGFCEYLKEVSSEFNDGLDQGVKERAKDDSNVDALRN